MYWYIVCLENWFRDADVSLRGLVDWWVASLLLVVWWGRRLTWSFFLVLYLSTVLAGQRSLIFISGRCVLPLSSLLTRREISRTRLPWFSASWLAFWARCYASCDVCWIALCATELSREESSLVTRPRPLRYEFNEKEMRTTTFNYLWLWLYPITTVTNSKYFCYEWVNCSTVLTVSFKSLVDGDFTSYGNVCN